MTRALEIRPLGDFTATDVGWLWPGRIPSSRLTMIAGDPGAGKSFLTSDLAARITAGKPWPDGAGLAPVGNVLILNAEDSPADTIRPRIEACGGDVSRVSFVDCAVDGDKRYLVDFRKDLGIFKTALQDGEFAAAFIDPITTYLGLGSDSRKDSDVRHLLTLLDDAARVRKVALQAVMHLNKAQQMDALYRVSGALAFVSVPRVSYLVAEHPDDPEQRVLAPIKFNLGLHKTPTSLAFRLSEQGVIWSPEPSDLTRDDLLSPVDRATGAERDEARSQLDEAADFLKANLDSGPLLATEVQKRATSAGIAKRTLSRAKDKLGVKSFSNLGAWAWQLPQPKDAKGSALALLKISADGTQLDGKDAKSANVAALATLNETAI